MNIKLLFSVIALLFAPFSPPTNPERCQDVPDFGAYACVWTIDETHLQIGVRWIERGKPQAHIPVRMTLTSTGPDSYVCRVNTTPNASCRFGVAANQVLGVRVNMGYTLATQFIWRDGTWQ